MGNKYFLIILIFFCFLTLTFVGNTYAEESASTQYFTVEYELGRQSVWTNSIPIDIFITPDSDFKRVEINFSYGTITEVSYRGPQFFPVQEGQTYHVKARVHPKEKGTHHITINAIAWEYNTNYTSSNSVSIPIDEKLQIIPQSQTYKVLNVLKYIFIILVVVGIGFGVYFLAIKNSDKIKQWLEPEF